MENKGNSYTDNKTWIQAAILCLVICATYSISYTFDFINYGDPSYVYGNEKVAAGLNKTNLLWAFKTTEEANLWHPLTWVSLLSESSLLGANATAGTRHLVNVLLHLFSALILWRILSRLIPYPWLAVIVTLLWATHPQRVQSVIWISERKEVLASCFMMLSFWAWIHAEDKAKRLFRLLSFLSFGIALLAKPSVAPFPLLLFCYQLFIVHKKRNLTHTAKTLKSLIPHFATAAIVSLITIFTRSSGEVSEVFPFLQRISLIPLNIGLYLKNFIWPFPGQIWIHPPESGLSPVMIFVSWFVLIGCIGLIWWFARHITLSIFGLLWFLIFWLPVSGIIPVSVYYVADRYSYLPQIGLFLFACGFIQKIPSLNTKKLLISGTVLTLAMVAITVPRALRWKNSETLFTKEMAINSRSFLAPIYLGNVYLERGNVNKATELFTIATQKDTKASLPWLNLGKHYESLGEEKPALDAYVKACYCSPKNVQAFIRAAALYSNRKEYEDADDVLDLGLHYKPKEVQLWVSKGELSLDDLNDPKQATKCYLQAVEVAPRNPDALLGMALIHIRYGAPDKARSLLEDAHKYTPERTDIKTTLDILNGQ